MYIEQQTKIRQKKMRKHFNEMVQQYVDGELELKEVQKYQKMM